MFTKSMNKETKYRLFHSQIKSLISILKYARSGKKILISVDYSLISRYTFPSYLDNTVSQKEKANFYKDILAYDYLFEVVPKKNQLIYLLPPYIDELKESIYALSIRKYIEVESIRSDNNISGIIEDFLNNPHINRYIEQGKLKNLEENEIFEFLEIVKNDFLEIYVLSTIGLRNTAKNLKEVYKSLKVGNRFISIDHKNSELPKKFDFEVIKNNTEIKWFQKLEKKWSGKRSLNNYRDALAIEYIHQINEKLFEKEQMMIFLTHSEFDSILEVKPVSFTIDNEQIMIPQILHPLIIFIFLTFAEYEKDGTTLDYTETIESLIDFYKIIKETDSLMDSIHDFPKRVLKYELKDIGLSIDGIDSNIDYIENIKMAIKASRKPSKEFLSPMIDKLSSKKQNFNNRVIKRFNDLLEAFYKDKELGSYLDEKVDCIIKNMKTDLDNLLDLIPIEKAAYKIISQSPARLTFSEDDFKDSQIISIINELNLDKKGEKYRTIFEKLFKIKKENITSNSTEEINRGWEASLLLTQLKVRTYTDAWALKDIDFAMANAPDHLKPLYSFLNNVVLSRKANTFEKALSSAKDLKINHGKENPRYLLQYGYFVWRAQKKNLKGYTIDQAIIIMEEAYQLAKQLNKITCKTLSLANLINLNVETNNIEKALFYRDELKLDLDIQDDIPIVIYSNSLVAFLQLQKKLEEEIFQDVSSEIEDLEMRLNHLKEILKNDPVPLYVDKIYSIIFKDFSSLKNAIHIRNQVNQMIESLKIEKNSEMENIIRLKIDEIQKITSIKCLPNFKFFEQLSATFAKII